MAGVSSTALPLTNIVDDLIGNYGSNTRRISISRLAAIIAALMGPTHATRAALYADLAWPVGAVGYVRGDGTPAYNGVYRKSGASGSGSWTRIGDLPTSAVEAGLIDDLRSEMRAAGNAGDILRLTGYGGTADAVTGDLRVDQAHITVAIGQMLAIVWPGANTATDPTLTFGGLVFVVRRRTGVLGPGDLQSARYLGVVASMPAGASPGVIRIMEAVSAADITGLYPALRDGATLPTTVSGTGDAVVLTISADLQAVGVSAIGTASELEYLCTAANTVANPAIAVIGSGTQNFTARDADGNAWPAGGFVSGRTYKLRRRGTVLRVVGGDITRADLAARITADEYGSVVTLTSVAGTGDAITASIPAALAATGVTAASVRHVRIQIAAGNTVSGVTLSLDGGAATLVRDAAGNPLAPGALVAGRVLELERISSQWRLMGALPPSDRTIDARAVVVETAPVAQVSATLPEGALAALSPAVCLRLLWPAGAVWPGDSNTDIAVRFLTPGGTVAVSAALRITDQTKVPVPGSWLTLRGPGSGEGTRWVLVERAPTLAEVQSKADAAGVAADLESYALAYRRAVTVDPAVITALRLVTAGDPVPATRLFSVEVPENPNNLPVAFWSGTRARALMHRDSTGALVAVAARFRRGDILSVRVVDNNTMELVSALLGSRSLGDLQTRLASAEAGLADHLVRGVTGVRQVDGALPARPAAPFVEWYCWSDPSALMRPWDKWVQMPSPELPLVMTTADLAMIRFYGASGGVNTAAFTTAPEDQYPQISAIQVSVDAGPWQQFRAAPFPANAPFAFPALAVGEHELTFRRVNFLGAGEASVVRRMRAHGTAFIDSFASAFGSGSGLSARDNWEASAQWAITSGQLRPTVNNGTATAFTTWDGIAAARGAGLYAAADVYREAASNRYIGPVLAAGTAWDNTLHLFIDGFGADWILRQGESTILAQGQIAGGAPVTGPVRLRLEVTADGTQLRVRLGGSIVATLANPVSEAVTLRPGIRGYRPGGGGAGEYYLTNFEAGRL